MHYVPVCYMGYAVALRVQRRTDDRGLQVRLMLEHCCATTLDKLVFTPLCLCISTAVQQVGTGVKIGKLMAGYGSMLFISVSSLPT